MTATPPPQTDWRSVPADPTEDMYRHMESVAEGRVTRMQAWRIWHAMVRGAPMCPQDTGAIRRAADELRAIAALIERPPLDDVHLVQSVAVRMAGAIRTILAGFATHHHREGL
ncbi:hypothetical protein ASE75_06185 [Sphingomonas sp. Leaf17]|uniref:hypothetical protein n=1 Tax=Sphingomonas sp. Leaf17 TaxID=1735683 RepID=UPI0006FB44B0|nr:hypothetical protein [Sphingomonas sp. Leaf17]KQM65815.1 hypothetical protein ASE75_06185 [Sphingomonas sp. Leaf17]